MPHDRAALTGGPFSWLEPPVPFRLGDILSPDFHTKV
jgi:hypothetical protein